MVDLKEKTIHLGCKTEPILRFEVWFASLHGLHTSLEAAQLQADKIGVDEIRAVPVAISETMYEAL